MTDSQKGANTGGNKFHGGRANSRQKGYRVPTKNHHVNTHRTQKARYWRRKLSGPSRTTHISPPPSKTPTHSESYMCTMVAFGFQDPVVPALFCFIVIFMPVVLFWHFWQILVPYSCHPDYRKWNAIVCPLAFCRANSCDCREIFTGVWGVI